MDGYINKSNLMWLERLILSLLIGAVYYYPNSLISEIPVVSSQDINFLKLGRAIFEQSCAVGYCHGKAGRAGRGPRLRGKEWDSKYLIKVIENGIPNSSMPGWKSRLSTMEIQGVAAYIETLSKLAPNDPEPSLTSIVMSSNLSTSAQLKKPESQLTPEMLPSDKNHTYTIMGNPVKGKALFFDIGDKFNCNACHRFNSKGINVGPDLRDISKKPVREILKDIILPDVNSTTSGHLFLLTTQDGEQLEAVKVSESATRIKIFDVTSLPPVLRSFKIEQVKSLEFKRPSAMPETYGQRYTLIQLLDIIAFLKSTDTETTESVFLNDLF